MGSTKWENSWRRTDGKSFVVFGFTVCFLMENAEDKWINERGGLDDTPADKIQDTCGG